MALLAGILAQRYSDHMDGWGGGWMWLWGTLMMLAFVAVVALVVWAVIRGTQARPASPTDRAREVLAERYARGELSTDEYRERLDTLR